MQLLGQLTPSDFLKQYWQKKPLLIRQALPDYQSPISAEELAGLACEEGVESRLILEHGDNSPWQLRYGPFSEGDFTSLPKSNWSLLVQAVNHHLPELNELLDEFNFIPNWRIDDLMISYAPIQGSVGPHLDNYDVFLLQAQGRRHWHINENDYTEDDLVKDLELKILDNFSAKQDWILEPGDMLYLPPGVAHHGIALDNCLTYSIGFRAPSQKELLSAFTVNFNDVAKDTFYSDPKLQLQDSPGEIKQEPIDAMRQMIISAISDEIDFESWFGKFITENRNNYEEEQETLNENDFYTELKKAGSLIRYGNIRLSYIKNNKQIRFFYTGHELALSIQHLPLVAHLCSQHRITYQTSIEIVDESLALALLYTLYRGGCLYFDE